MGDDELRFFGPDLPEWEFTQDAIDRFLDKTKEKREVEVANRFPNFNLVLVSAQYTMRHVSMSEFDKQKQYRLKKLVTKMHVSLTNGNIGD